MSEVAVETRSSAPPPGRDWRSALVAAAFALALLFLLAARLGWVASLARAETAQPLPAATNATEASDQRFGLGLAENGGRRDERFHRAVYLVRGTNRTWFGTFVGGDAFTGKLVSPAFTLDRDAIEIPIAGYPALPGNSLVLEIRGAGAERAVEIPFAGENPREAEGRWRVDVGAWKGRAARLVLVDGVTTRTGWLAVRAPLGVWPEPSWIEDIPRNYLWMANAVLAIVALLFLPGLAWRTWWPRRWDGSVALLPLPGLALLVLAGVAVWTCGPGAFRGASLAALGGAAGLAAALAWTWFHRGGPLPRGEVVELGVFASVALAALAFGVLPAVVEQEYHGRTTHQARMVASPPDHEIPYRTAVYFFHGKDGRADRAAYFGDDWAATSRGPLVPLAILGVMTAFDARPSDPPGDSLVRWPASPDAFYLARIVGVLLNALVLLGAAALVAAIRPVAGRFALAWLAVAPVVAINADFLWPKLLATFFALLAITELVRGTRHARAGLWVALAYLSHPVGGLFAPAIGLFLLHRAWCAGGLAAAGRASVRFAGAIALTVAPWIAFKMHVGFADVFLRYPLGYGQGLLAAPSFRDWLACRWSNLWITLTPGGFFFSPHMHYWIEGELSAHARWVIGYARGLPGGVGLAAFPLLAIALGRRAAPTPPGFRGLLLGGAFALMLLFWGYSLDGLGRNCLEPLTVLAIVFAAVATAERSRGPRWLIAIVAVETLSVRVLGLASDLRGPAAQTAESFVLGAIALVAMLAPLALLREPRV